MSLEPFCHCEERKWLRGVAEANWSMRFLVSLGTSSAISKGDKSPLSLEGRGLG